MRREGCPSFHQTDCPLRSVGPRVRPAVCTSTHLLFDVSDLVYYIGEHANLTGIQRVQSSIVLA